jgi:transposase-like protein
LIGAAAQRFGRGGHHPQGVRYGAWRILIRERMLAEALAAEVDAYIAQFTAERGECGRRLVVRNGYHQSRGVLTSAGAVEVTVPRVSDKRTDPATGERQRFTSAILPPWCRKTPKMTEVLPLLYLHGLSSGDFVPALGQFLGSSAGLSAALITRLTQAWQAGRRAFAARDLSGVDYVYLCADGIHVNIRLAGSRPGHGVQAHRVSTRPLARRQRPPPGRPGPRRSDLHRRQARRAT